MAINKIENEYFEKSKMSVDINVINEMRDGVNLYSDIYYPGLEGKYPNIN